MAGPKETTVKSKSKSRKRYFLCCFGISNKSSKPKQFQDELKSSNRKKKNRLFIWKRFRVKKTAIQTVPVETTSPTNPNPVSEIEEIPSSPDQTVNPKPLMKESKNSISETRQSPESNKCEAKRNCISEQASPREKFANLTKALSHSVSFPAIQATAVQATGMARSGLGIRKGLKGSRKLDKMTGMSIIMVTLIIMVIWGKFCAILCTAAWLYFVPRIRTQPSVVRVRNGEMINTVETPMSIKEYKKKVVMEGLLRRSRRRNIGV